MRVFYQGFAILIVFSGWHAYTDAQTLPSIQLGYQVYRANSYNVR